MASLAHRHVPPYLIDRLLAGVLPAEVAAAVGRQQQGCDLCTERVALARQAQEAFLTRHPPPRRARELLSRFDRGRRRRRLAWSLPAISVFGLALFIAGSGWQRVRGPGPSVAAPRAPSVGFSVFRPGSPGPRPGVSGERLRRGDAVQLHLDAGRFRGAHVFSVDDLGRAEPLFDWSPSSGISPSSLVLDGALGSEQIVVLFHDLPDPAIELPRLREAVARARPGAERADPVLLPPDGREIVTGSILIRKESPPDADVPPDLSRTL